MEQVQELVETDAPQSTALPDYRRRHQRDIPEEYSPVTFFGTTNIAGLGIMVAAGWQLEAIQALEWLAVPFAFLFSNLAEYLIHRGPLHKKNALLEILFNRHTLLHHDYFRHDDMAFTRRQELSVVLFPYWAIGFVLAGALVPYSLLLMVTTPNVAHLFVATAIGYYLLYEWLHLTYHLPETSRVAQIGIVQMLRNHHRIHHHRKLMQRYNFNITFPLFDRLLGTMYNGQNPQSEEQHHHRRHHRHRESRRRRTSQE